MNIIELIHFITKKNTIKSSVCVNVSKRVKFNTVFYVVLKMNIFYRNELSIKINLKCIICKLFELSSGYSICVGLFDSRYSRFTLENHHHHLNSDL